MGINSGVDAVVGVGAGTIDDSGVAEGEALPLVTVCVLLQSLLSPK